MTLRIFGMLGREVMSLISGELREAGRHEIAFHGSRLGSGIYSYAITPVSTANQQEFSDMKQMILMK